MGFIGTLWRPKSIGERFSVAIGAGAAAVLLAMTVASYLGGRELLLFQTSGEALRQVQDEVGNWDDLIDRVSMLPYVIASAELTAPEKVDARWLAKLLERCPIKAVYGLYLVRESRDWRDPESDIWVDRKSWPRPAMLKYDFHDPGQEWYAGAKKGDGIHVTKPYFDAGGSEIDMISVTLPLRDPSGTFLGVAGVDLSLEEMRRVVGEMHLRDFGSSPFLLKEESEGKTAGNASSPLESAFMISRRGNVIISPQSVTRSELRGSISGEAARQSLADSGLPLTAEHLRRILDDPKGWLRAPEIGDKVLYWAQSRTTGWKLLLVVPYRMIVSPAIRLAWISSIVAGTGLLLLLPVILIVSRRISLPILRLREAAEGFERGDYAAGERILGGSGELGIEKRPDEIGSLARSFKAMTKEILLRERRLADWNEGLERTVRERTEALERANATMTAELAEAASYARAVLPPRQEFPVATDWVFLPSSRLGGDSFGYRWLDGDRFAVYLIDVCGHGVGAALLSVSVVNMLASGTLPDTDFSNPAQVLETLNRTFPMERHNEMFFTCWYGVYDRASSSLHYACGGHPPALLLTGSDGMIPLAAKGPVIGALPDAAFTNEEAVVPAGSLLYLFSDGAYEITREDGGMVSYGEFCDILRGSPPEAPLDGIVQAMTSLQAGGRFADDFSLVQCRFGVQESAQHRS